MPNFRNIANKARNNPTPANVLALVEEYASNKCGTYARDTELFLETYGGLDNAPDGYVFREVSGWGGVGTDLAVERTSQPTNKG